MASVSKVWKLAGDKVAGFFVSDDPETQKIINSSVAAALGSSAGFSNSGEPRSKDFQKPQDPQDP